MQIRHYTPPDEPALFRLLAEAGPDWSAYTLEPGRTCYARALSRSVTYLALEGPDAIGYVRCREDDGFGVYVYDLLVATAHRGRQIGRLLMEQICADYPDQTVYVMSDADGYYEKLGYARAGSIFIVRPRQQEF